MRGKIKKASLLRAEFALELVDKTWKEGGLLSSTTAGVCAQARAELQNAIRASRTKKRAGRGR